MGSLAETTTLAAGTGLETVGAATGTTFFCIAGIGRGSVSKKGISARAMKVGTECIVDAWVAGREGLVFKAKL